MKAKDKKNVLKAFFGLVVVFVVYMLILANIKITENTPAFWLKQNEFVLKVWENITTNIIIYGFLAIAVVVIYYFLVYKPQIKRTSTRRK